MNCCNAPREILKKKKKVWQKYGCRVNEMTMDKIKLIKKKKKKKKVPKAWRTLLNEGAVC